MCRNKPVIAMPEGVGGTGYPSLAAGLKGVKGRMGGVGPDSPTVTGEHGGKQSALPFAFTLISPCAQFRLASILHEGALKHGAENWRLISISDHINHALMHITAHLHEDKQDDHLGHAFCRLMFALSLEIGTDPLHVTIKKETEDHAD